MNSTKGPALQGELVASADAAWHTPPATPGEAAMPPPSWSEATRFRLAGTVFVALILGALGMLAVVNLLFPGPVF
jgi:hypothetical protein